MAVAFDNNGFDTAGGRTGIGSTSFSGSTIAASTVMVIFPVLTTGTKTVTGVTVDGAAATLLDSNTSNGLVYAYGIKGLSSGSHTIAVTYSGTLSGGQTEQTFWSSYTGADPVTPFPVTSNSDNRVLAITTGINNSIVVDCILATSSDLGSANVAQTQLNLDNLGVKTGTSYKALPAAGSTTMAWNINSGTDTGNPHVDVAISPTGSAAVSGRSDNLTLLGVS